MQMDDAKILQRSYKRLKMPFNQEILHSLRNQKANAVDARHWTLCAVAVAC
jgi:hypothetical protein